MGTFFMEMWAWKVNFRGGGGRKTKFLKSKYTAWNEKCETWDDTSNPAGNFVEKRKESLMFEVFWKSVEISTSNWCQNFDVYLSTLIFWRWIDVDFSTFSQLFSYQWTDVERWISIWHFQCLPTINKHRNFNAFSKYILTFFKAFSTSTKNWLRPLGT